MSDKEEGAAFEAAFQGLFANPERTADRVHRERRAGMTPKQRARKAVRTEQVNFRASPEVKALATTIAERLECSVADVMEKAILVLAKLHRIEAPK